VEERVFIAADIDERGFQAAFEILDLTLEDRADHAALAFALDIEFLEHAVGEQRDAFFEGLGVDDKFAVGVAVVGEGFHDALNDGEFFGTGGGLFVEAVGIDRRRLVFAGGRTEIVVFVVRQVVVVGNVGH